jgi:branched-chain amino acid transport system ATP-binding protein
MPGLVLADVTRSFEGLVAVANLSFEVRPRAITALIGPNGAGKTTIFNLISGLLRPTAGAITFEAMDLTQLSPHEICRAGIGRTFQTPQSFGRMTAIENVMVAAQVRSRAGFITAGLALPRAPEEEGQLRERALEWLAFIGLADRADRIAGTLGLGEQRMLDLARALATEPKLLLLDEPAAGLNQSEVARLRETLFRVRDRAIAILVVEHNMRFVLRTADHVVVLNFGRKLAEGTPADIARDAQVISAYLGQASEAAHA